ncbi:MAG TPA: tetratricopeptide repeat protein [Ktedonobacteraceae bacterium]|nr:tetratricopeptide repeat protein [Ktedonobacteraceae bacterium]
MQENATFDATLGYMLRERRLELGWDDVTQAAILYGEAVRGVPITRKAYLRMEEGYLPQSPKRRLILAAMLGLAPAVLGVPEIIGKVTVAPSAPVSSSPKVKALNVKEYRAALLSYWRQGYSDPHTTMRSISQRIQILHNNVLYCSSSEQEEMKRLLCGFHIRYGDIARKQGFDKSAIEHFRKAIILAHEEGYKELEASALHMYGAYFFDKGDFKNASRQFAASLRLKASPAIKGCTLALNGFSQACLATDDIVEALMLIEAAEKMLDYKPEPQDEIGQVVLTPEGFHLFKARTFVASPVKKLRVPDAAEEAITETIKLMSPDTRTDRNRRHIAHRQLESNLVMSQVWLDRDYYPIATSLAQDALKIGEKLGSNTYLSFVDRIYTSLQSSSYGKDVEVARLGIQLTKLKHNQMFNN